MKLVKIALAALLMVVSVSAVAQVRVNVDVGGHGYYSHGVYHGPGVVRYHGYYGGPRYYPAPVVVVPQVVFRNYDPYAGFVRVETYCTNQYGEQYFCGYQWVRQ